MKKKYFWDVDEKKLDMMRDKAFIVRRIIEYGDMKDMEKAVEMYGKRFVIDILKKGRFSVKSANFWRVYFGLSKKEVLCLKKSLIKKQKVLWNC